MEYEVVLMHHGIKGMRWGVRRYQNKDGTLTTAGKKRYSKELAYVKEQEQILKNRRATQSKLDKLSARKKAVEEANKALDEPNKNSKAKHKTDPEDKPKKRTLSDLSNEEIQARIDRIRLENTYKDLVSPKKEKTRNRGKEFIKDVLENSGKNLATQVVNQVGASLLNKAFSNSETLGKRDKDGKPIDVIFANNKKKDK